MNGRLIGINRMIVSPSGASSGIGFAIPANLVRVVAEAARLGGPPQRPWLGADFETVTTELADSLGLEIPSGVMVTAVDPGEPAAAAGLTSGDLILSVDGVDVEDVVALNYRLAIRGVGGEVRLGIARDGLRYVATVALEPPPETVAREEAVIGGSSPFSGLSVVNLSPAVAEELGYNGQVAGVIVSQVVPSSRAAFAGFRRGDVIADVNGVDIDNTHRLAEVSATRTSSWNWTLVRGEQIISQSFRG